MKQENLKEREKLKELYQELYLLTNPVCATKCVIPQSCCSPEYCEYAIDWAKRGWGEELKPTSHPKLPLMGPEGCVAPPHTRPMCTAHVCEATLYKQGQRYWDVYWKIRNQISELEWRLFKDVP